MVHAQAVRENEKWFEQVHIDLRVKTQNAVLKQEVKLGVVTYVLHCAQHSSSYRSCTLIYLLRSRLLTEMCLLMFLYANTIEH